MLPTPRNAKELVAEISKCDFDINTFYSRVVIDAKSILGVLSLDLTQVLIVEYNGNSEDFETYLNTKAAGKMTAAQYLKKKREL